MLKEHLFPDR